MERYRSNEAMSPMKKAFLESIHISEEDLSKPKIAIVNSSSGIAPCFAHLDDVAKVVADDLRENGAIPIEIRTTAPSDFMFSGHGGGYITGSRDLISFDIEAAIEGAELDGMICLASCDKTLPGQMMAATRLNIPTIIVAGGYQPAGNYKGKRFDIEDLFLQFGYYITGNLSKEEIDEMSRNAVMGPGVCQGIGTANTMHMAGEALGFCLPGTTPVLANSDAMWNAVHRASRQIVELVKKDVRPRDILTPASFENAVKVVLAVCGSTNAIKHLQAIAHSADMDNVDVFQMFDEYADDIPLLAGIKPNGPYSIDDLEKAGGTAALMKQLSSKLRLEAMTVSGKTVGENMQNFTVKDESIIRPLDNAFNYRPAIVMVKGNIASDYGIIKLQIDDSHKQKFFRGPARVFADPEDAVLAIKEHEIQKGDVIVLPGLGLTGTPGMGGVTGPLFALEGVGLGSDVAIITDGHASGLCNAALMAVDVCPEAADGGVIGLIRDGDVITMDTNNKVLNVDLSEEEIEARRKIAPNYKKSGEHGWLKLLQERAKPLHQGAVIS
jgi:dihydroxy-acid dehydratase